MPQVRANGIDVEYWSFGSAGDPAILLIMGFGGQLTLWPETFCRGLAARGFRVIRFDNRAVGKSTHFTTAGAPDMAALMSRAMSGQPVETPWRPRFRRSASSRSSSPNSACRWAC